MPDKKFAVVAIGGNSLIKDAKHQTVEDQYLAARKRRCTSRHDRGRLGRAIGHGNGPQSALSCAVPRSPKVEGMHEVPLDVCGPIARAR